MRRGFKTEARDIAQEIRSELGLTPVQALDPWALAKHLDIPVWPLSTFANAAPDCVTTLTGSQHGSFHGMIAFLGSRRVIVHNDANALTRQRSDIAHELAHALLLHAPQAPTDGQSLEYDVEQEDEAGWLGGVLLVTDDACLHACRNGDSVANSARRLGVSRDLMQWRINASGARRRVERARQKADND